MTTAIPRKTIFGFLFCGAGMLACFVFLYLIAPRFTYGSPAGQRPFIAMSAALVLAGVFYLGALSCLKKGVTCPPLFWYMLLLGLILRGLCFFSAPLLEDDFYRYLWDGAVTAQGYNPYAYIPEEVQGGVDNVPASVQALAQEAGVVLGRVNHPHLGTVYPPLAQAFFALAFWISPFQLWGWRLLLLLTDIMVAILLLRILRHLKKPALILSIYWLNPLLIKETINSAHMDILILLFLMLACWWALQEKPWPAIAALALAAATKLWPIFLAPLLFRTLFCTKRQACNGALFLLLLVSVLFLPMMSAFTLKGDSGFLAYGEYWEMNDALYMPVEWCCALFTATTRQAGLLARILIGGMLALTALLIAAPASTGRNFFPRTLLFIALMFFFSPTQFPWYYLWLLPFLVITPRWWLLLLTATLPLYYLRFHFRYLDQVGVFDNGLVWLEYLPSLLVMVVEEPLRWRHRVRTLQEKYQMRRQASGNPTPCKREEAAIAVIIPVLNEEDSIAKVIADIPVWVDDIIIADNGSTDATAALAEAAGGRVIEASRRGYGSACLAGIAALADPDTVIFLDGDYSDHPEQMDRLVDPILAGQAEMVIGSRMLGAREAGALTPQARFGNWLATRLIRLFWGEHYTDLGPFRAIRYSVLQALEMNDPDFGWTVEMQIKAAQQGVPAMEVPVDYRKRIGRSKISGTVKGVFLAGNKILGTIFAAVAKQ